MGVGLVVVDVGLLQHLQQGGNVFAYLRYLIHYRTVAKLIYYPPALTQVKMSCLCFQGLYTCGGAAIQCEKPEECPGECFTRTCCNIGGGDCGGYLHYFYFI